MSAIGNQTQARPLAWQPGLAAADAPALARIGLDPAAGGELRLPPGHLGGTLAAESWLTTAAPAHGRHAGVDYAAGEAVCFGQLACTDTGDPAAVAEDAYRRLLAVMGHLGYPHLLRVWHYLGRINVGEGDAETYKRFCQGRARALDEHAGILERLPAATVVGAGDQPGLHLHFLLGHAPIRPLENPRQVSAYRYPREYGPRQPTFARAVVVDWKAGRQLFVSGTASIVGHATRHPGDAAAQVRESLANLAAVFDAARPDLGEIGWDDLDCLKVYVRRRQDLPAIAGQVEATLGPSVPVAYLEADLCRRDLLVELETQVTEP